MQAPEHLSEDELAYHRSVLAQMQAAQGAWQSWSKHLATKYQLRPSDSIDEYGQIRREVTATDAP